MTIELRWKLEGGAPSNSRNARWTLQYRDRVSQDTSTEWIDVPYCSPEEEENDKPGKDKTDPVCAGS